MILCYLKKTAAHLEMATVTRTRSGRVSKPPERYEPVEVVTDDFAEDEYDDDDEGDSDDSFEEEDSDEEDDDDEDADENGNLKGFVADDDDEEEDDEDFEDEDEEEA